jgi:hypothetical protein
MMKLDRPTGLWEKATEVHAKSRSATFSVLHLPAIDANMSISGSCRLNVVSKECNRSNWKGNKRNSDHSPADAHERYPSQNALKFCGCKDKNARGFTGPDDCRDTIGAVM